MERPIKYKRFYKIVTHDDIQIFFDDLIKDGWEIIYYNEIKPKIDTSINFTVIVVASKKQNNIL